MILHLVTLTGTTQEPLHEIIPVGPFEIRIQYKGKVGSLVNQRALNINEKDGWTSFKIDQLGLHDVLVIE